MVLNLIRQDKLQTKVCKLEGKLSLFLLCLVHKSDFNINVYVEKVGVVG